MKRYLFLHDARRTHLSGRVTWAVCACLVGKHALPDQGLSRSRWPQRSEHERVLYLLGQKARSRAPPGPAN